MNLKSIISTFLMLAILIALNGCSSKGTKQTAEEVKPKEKSLKAFVIPSTKEDRMREAKAFGLYADAHLLELEGDLPAAAKYYKAALQQRPNSYEIRFSLAMVHHRLHHFEDVLEILSTISPEDYAVYDIRAGCYRALGMQDKARNAYYHLIDLSPNDTKSYSYLAGVYRAAGQLDSTLWAYGNLVRLRPDNYRLYQEYGRLQAEAGHDSSAIESFRKSIEVEPGPTNILSYIGIGELYTRGNQRDSALTAYKAGLEVDTASMVIHKVLSTLYLTADSAHQALYHARKLVELSPQDHYAYRGLATIYFIVDSLDQAESIFNKLVGMGERHPGNHYYLGRIAFLKEDFQKAVSEFTVLTQLADTVSESWLDLAIAYRKLDKPDDEILTYQTGLNHMKSEPAALRLYFAMGSAYEQQGNAEKAIEVFEEIIARSPDHSQALNYLGYMLADSNEQLEYALELITQAVELSPDNIAYLDSYGWVYYRMGKYDLALEHLRKAVSLGVDPVIFDHLGDALNATGQVEEAKTWWQKAIELQPENQTIKEKLGQ